MNPRRLIPHVLEPEPTPMGTRPLNPWVHSGAGGGPWEPAGWYPRKGNTLAPGYDGIGPARSQSGIGPARSMVGLTASMRYATEEDRAMTVPTRPKYSSRGERSASYVTPPPPAAYRTQRFYGLGNGEEEPADSNRKKYLGPILLGVLVGAGLAYIAYDETMGTGAKLRRQRVRLPRI